jgi:hypothetical protein
MGKICSNLLPVTDSTGYASEVRLAFHSCASPQWVHETWNEDDRFSKFLPSRFEIIHRLADDSLVPVGELECTRISFSYGLGPVQL